MKEFEPLHLITEDEEEDDRLEAIAGYVVTGIEAAS